MAAREGERQTELRFEPERHLFYTDGEIECCYYPGTRSVEARRMDGSEYMAFNFESLGEFVNYVRALYGR